MKSLQFRIGNIWICIIYYLSEISTKTAFPRFHFNIFMVFLVYDQGFSKYHKN